MYKLTQEQIEQIKSSPQYQLNRKQSEIRKIKIWFKWYDQQIIQYLRARRQGLKWTTIKDGILIEDIEELDNLANQKAAEIRDLQSSIKDIINQIKEQKIPEEF